MRRFPDDPALNDLAEKGAGEAKDRMADGLAYIHIWFPRLKIAIGRAWEAAMASMLHKTILLLGCGLLTAAAPVERSDLVSAEIESAMIQESYASMVDAHAAQAAREAGHVPLADLIDTMSAQNKARFDDHAHVLPAETLEDRLTQVFAALLAQEIQYNEAAVQSREAQDSEMADHFDKLAGEVRFERHRFEVEVERSLSGAPSL